MITDRSFWLISILLGAFSSFGQVADTSFYANGKIREIKFRQGEHITSAVVYKETGEVKYQWSIVKRTLESFDAITYLDTLAEYFKANCRNYTVLQHYGNGPLMEVENYRDNKRDGSYELFERDGTLISKGQFAEWKKVGIWTYYDADGKSDRHIHWFHHDYYEQGISIDYTIIPVAVTTLLIATLLFLSLKYSTFSLFFVSYSLFAIGLFGILFLISSVASKHTMSIIVGYVGHYSFPILTTVVAIKMIVSIFALIFWKRVGASLVLTILFLLTSIGLSILLFISYISAKLSGVMLG